MYNKQYFCTTLCLLSEITSQQLKLTLCSLKANVSCISHWSVCCFAKYVVKNMISLVSKRILDDTTVIIE